MVSSTAAAESPRDYDHRCVRRRISEVSDARRVATASTGLQLLRRATTSSRGNVWHFSHRCGQFLVLLLKPLSFCPQRVPSPIYV
jgi:hypothetical protein